MPTKTVKKVSVPTPAINIYDVAQKAGVSVVTVSRAFNNYKHVSDRMRKRVMQAARELGFSPKLVAKPRRIGVVIGHLDQLHGGGYKTRLMMHLISHAASRGYVMEFIPADRMDGAVQRSVDGIIEFGLTSREVHALNSLPDIPVVLINKRYNRNASWSTICSDHWSEGHEAARYLMERGHRSVALVLDERVGWSAGQRMKGFTKAFRQKGGDVASPLILDACSQSLAALASAIVKARCTALVNLSDNVGHALTGVLRNEWGLSIPKNISVIGLDDDNFSPHFSPPLTTIEQPLQLLAEGAVDGLLDCIERKSKPFHQIIPCRLIERDSVCPPGR